MPIHDWTRVMSGTFHDFHQDWTIEIRRTLNRGILPTGHFATIAALESASVGDPFSDPAAYALRANRIVIQRGLGTVVAMIEVVSPGNKDSRHAIRTFTEKLAAFIRAGIHVVVVDLFPPGPRDPAGVHALIWDELGGEPFPPRPASQPLAVAGYDAGPDPTAYVDSVAVGDALPDAPLFLAPGWYVNIPLESTYAVAWAATPLPIQELVEPPARG